MKLNRIPRLAVLITHPIQYYAPLYKTLSERGNIDLHVLFLSDAGAIAYHDPGFIRTLSWDIPLLEGYQYRILEPGFPLEESGFWLRHSSKLKQALDTLNPDFIQIYGYASRMNWMARRWAIRHKKKIIYFSDSNIYNSRSTLKNLAKHIVVSRFFKNVNQFLSTSEANEKYLKYFGAKENCIARIPFAIEYHRWSSLENSLSTRRRYHFAWAGKLTTRKRPFDFINALRIVGKNVSGGIDAILIGDGELKEGIEKEISTLPDYCRVKMTGFVNQKDMPITLQQANSFVFTSMNEPYGLAATEAAAAGLALVVADKMGCVGDTVLARPGVNAMVYPAGDVNALAAAMLKLINEPDVCIKMQQASQAIAKKHDVSVAATIIEEVVHQRTRSFTKFSSSKTTLH